MICQSNNTYIQSLRAQIRLKIVVRLLYQTLQIACMNTCKYNAIIKQSKFVVTFCFVI